ncbi:MAG: DUF5916 domain-containing protein [Vicinamibacterales bacterium]
MTRRLGLGAWTVVLVCLGSSARGSAQTPAPSTVPAAESAGRLSTDIPAVSQAPKIEAFLSGEPPQLPGRIVDFRQREPRDGKPATRDTSAYLSYDKDHLYVVFVCKDDLEGIRARFSKREAIKADDQVSVFLDTFHDRQRAYVFASNPLGIQADRVKTEGQDDDESFDTLWETEARLTSFGYVVKMTIPFQSLRFPGQPEQEWGIALSRRIQRLNEDVYWPLVSKRVQGVVPQFADARGLKRISPGANVQAIPYGVYTGVVNGDASSASRVDSRRLGMDAKVGLGSAFVLDATANPDFSEVETDDPQVTVNERFEVFFPERRPFFVENAGFFVTPVPLFFSRRILDPRGGVRLTGKSGPWVAAALAIEDRPTPEAAGATVFVGSLRRELGARAHLGALVTWRGEAARSNRVASVDGRWALGKTWALAGQAILTQVSPTASAAAGADARRAAGYLGEVTRNGRHLDLLGRYTDIPAEFAADLGFIRRRDIRQADGEAIYFFRPKRGPIVKYGPRVDTFVVWDHARELTDWRLRPRFEIELLRQTSVLVDYARSYERYRGVDFRKARSTAEFETEWTDWLALQAAIEWGTDVNRRPAAGLGPFLANRHATSFGLSLRPGRHVRFDETVLRTRLDATAGPGGTTSPVFDDLIFRSKLNLQFSRTVSVRGILDYEALDPGPALSSLRRRRQLGLDLLGTVQLNPGTALFVGYVNRYEPYVIDDNLSFVDDYRSVGQQVFVKLSWLFRY